MAQDKTNSEHIEDTVNPEHEAALAGALALANLFSTCVEAFGLVHPAHKWEKEEQLLLVRLGLQQARLLIWGDIVGITSPPPTVTNHAVPKYPAAAYPDLKEPTFFGARDGRLDQPDTRTQVERALSTIVDRSASSSREEMMEKFGLKPPKRFPQGFEAALDTSRLEAFREKYELLQEVGEDFAQLNARRGSITNTSWTIADNARFARFIKVVQEQVDFLVNLMDVNERADRAVRMDIRAMGWHLAADRTRISRDTSKLRLIQEACKDEYPQYIVATKQALEQINRDSRENASIYTPPPARPLPVAKTPKPYSSAPPKSSHNATKSPSKKRPGLLSLLSFTKSSKRSSTASDIHSNDADMEAYARAAERSLSDAGPPRQPDDMAQLEPIRSKSVGAVLEAPEQAEMSEDEQVVQRKMAEMSVKATEKEPVAMVASGIARHDQYRGIARVETKDLRQPGVDYS